MSEDLRGLNDNYAAETLVQPQELVRNDGIDIAIYFLLSFLILVR